MNAPTSQAKFDLHLPGLLKVLAEHLYSDRRVGFRELLQNAHDSCSRRQIETGQDFEPQIHVSFERETHTLRIDDNGCGLTSEEIVSYLATIGRGYTRELREEIALSDPERYQELIGQFGLGFLSAFLVANEVEVQTLSYKPGSQPMCWKSNGDETYDMTPGDRSEIGTTVILKCKPAMRFLLDDEVLTELTQRFCDLLPFPIFIGQKQYPANRQQTPWASDAFQEDVASFLKSRGHHGNPVWMVKLEDWTIDLGHDTIKVPLSGVLYIPSRSIASVKEFGDATVYIRNMFITESSGKVLPTWAKFVRGIVETSMLQPTASREDIHEDENLELIQAAIEQQLLVRLDELSRSDSRLWNHVVNSHCDLIMGWAATSDRFFERIAGRIQLTTSRGMLTIKEYLDLSGQSTIYYQTKRSPTLCEQVLLEGKSTPVIDASWFGVLPFLERYAARQPGLKMVRTDSNLESLMRDVNHASFDSLIQKFEALGEQAKIAEFQPGSLPAIMEYSEHAEFVEDSIEAIENDELIPGVAELVSEYLEDLTSAGASTEGVLILNANSKLVMQMAQSAELGELPEFACQMVLQSAKLFSGRMMDARKCIDAYDTYSDAIMESLK